MTSKAEGSVRTVVTVVSLLAGGITAAAVEAQGTCADPTITITANPDVIQEGDEGQDTTVSWSISVDVGDDPDCDLAIDYQTQDISATAGSDYEAIAPDSDCITNSGVVANDTLDVLGDNVLEGEETFDIRVTSVEGCFVVEGSDQQQVRAPLPRTHQSVPITKVITIVDDEAHEQCATSVSFVDPTVSVTEGDSGTTPAAIEASVEVDTGGASGTCSVSLRYQTADGSATEGGSDYTPMDVTTPAQSAPSGVLSFPITVDVLGDTEVETNETFEVRIVEVVSEFVPTILIGPDTHGGHPDTHGGVQPAGHLSLPVAATVTIGNDDLPEIVIEDMEVVEGDAGSTDAVFTVRAEPMAAERVFVNFQTVDGTATVADGDYEAVSGQVIVEPMAPFEATITVPVNGDERFEDDETFTVELTDVDGGTIADGEGVGTILNDEGEPGVSINDVEVTEGDSGTTEAVFTVTVSPLTQDVSVDFATENGSATVGDDDYVAVSGSLLFNFDGANSQTITVPVVGDTRVEPDESFQVVLSNVQGADVGDSEGIATIRNDDENSIVRLIRPDPTPEGSGSATVVVERLQPSGEPASVRIAARGGTATENADFTPITATVTWAADEGGQRSVEVPLLDDNLVEQEETIRVTLSDPVEATLGSPSAVDLVILDNDQDGEVEIVGESDPEIVIEQSADLAVRVIKPDGTPIQGALVFWTVVEGNAELTSGSPTVTGPDGVSQQTVEVPIPDVVVIQAALEQPQQEQAGSASTQQEEEAGVTFRLRARGNLDLASDLNRDPNNLSVGGVLDFACIEPEGQFAEFCTYLFTLEDAQQAEVVRETTPREVAAQGNLMLELPQWGFREVGRRLAALRGGGSRRVEEELALVFEGQEVRLAALANQIVSAHARLKRMDQAVDEAIAAASQDPDATGEDGEDGDLEPQPRMDEIDPPSRWGLFVSGRLATADRDGSDREEGFEAGIEGLTLGVDYLVRDDLILGAAAGFLTTDLDLLQDGGGLDADGYFVTGYGAWFGDSFYLDGVLGYGSNSFDVRRHIDLPVPFQGASRFVAEGDTDGSQWMVNLGTGWDRAFGASSLELYGRGSYIEADLDGYIERGAGPFSLSIRDQSLDSLLAEAGLTYGYASSRSWGVLQPQLRAALLHEFGDDSRLVRGSFVQDVSQLEFVVPTDEPDRSFANLGVGVTAVTYHGRSFYLWYDTDLARDDLEVGTFTFGARFEF